MIEARAPLIQPGNRAYGAVEQPNANLAANRVAVIAEGRLRIVHLGIANIRTYANLAGRAIAYISRCLAYVLVQLSLLFSYFIECALVLPFMLYSVEFRTHIFDSIARRQANLERGAPQQLYRFVNRILGVQIPERHRINPILVQQRPLDPSINPLHFQKGMPLNAVPPIAEEINLDDLVDLAPAGIDLQSYVNQVKVGCRGLVGTPEEGTPEFEAFKDRLQLLAKHIILYLKSGKASDDRKFAICTMLSEASGNCGPRHMQETERAYDACLGRMDQARSPEEKIYAALELLRIEIIDTLNALFAAAEGMVGSPHIRAALLHILGEEYHISGGSQNDPFERLLNPQEVEAAFFAKYTEAEIIEQVFHAVIDTPRTEDQTDVLIDLFKQHIPKDWKPQQDSDEDEKLNDAAIQYKYLEQIVYDSKGKITRQAVRDLLVGLEVLNS